MPLTPYHATPTDLTAYSLGMLFCRYKVLHIQYVHLSLAFSTGVTAINSPSWEAFLLTLPIDAVMFGYKCLQWHSLNMKADVRGRSKYMTMVYNSITKGKIRVTSSAMSLKELRGYELIVESMSVSSVFVGMSVAFFVLVPFMPESFVTELWFGPVDTRWDKILFILVSLAVDFSQDALMGMLVRLESRTLFSRFFYRYTRVYTCVLLKGPTTESTTTTTNQPTTTRDSANAKRAAPPKKPLPAALLGLYVAFTIRTVPQPSHAPTTVPPPAQPVQVEALVLSDGPCAHTARVVLGDAHVFGRSLHGLPQPLQPQPQPYPESDPAVRRWLATAEQESSMRR